VDDSHHIDANNLEVNNHQHIPDDQLSSTSFKKNQLKLLKPLALMKTKPNQGGVPMADSSHA
jgi:hypothetical protein